MSESECEKAIVDTARRLGWTRVAHFGPAKTSRGQWVTAVKYDGKGWPDLFLARPGAVAVIEVKARGKKTTVEQDEWLRLIASAGIPVLVAWPEDYTQGRVEVWLRGLGGRGVRVEVTEATT